MNPATSYLLGRLHSDTYYISSAKPFFSHYYFTTFRLMKKQNKLFIFFLKRHFRKKNYVEFTWIFHEHDSDVEHFH